tara:strand:- start:634 stop:1398 length:765 start_codon:yes stop_codon:yes gene_type:complete
MISKIDLINWKLNERMNPLTKRKISSKGKVYKKLKESYDNNFKLDLSTIEDHIDIISQDRFIVLDNNVKKWIYDDLDNIIFYQENDTIRVFTITSIQYLKKNNVTIHPTSGKKIPDFVFDNINKINDKTVESLDNYSKTFFQKLSKHSIFINNEKYLELSDENITKLEFELKDFYYKNLGEEIRKIIDKKDGNVLFNNKPDNLELKLYLLKEMNNILKNISKDFLIFSYYIIVGALSIVIPEVKEDYPNYSFSF